MIESKVSALSFIRKHAWLWPILLLALILRIGRLDVMQFDFDDGIACIYAAQIVDKGMFLKTGLETSLHVFNPPFFIWLLCIPKLISGSPMLITAFIGLLATAAVALTYALADRFISRRAAIVAALMYAISPCALYYSRRIFAQDMMPLVSLMILFFILEYARSRKAHWLGLAVFVALIGPGIHFSGFALCLCLLLVIALLRLPLKVKPLAAAAACVMYMPYLFYLYGSGFEDLQIITETIIMGGNKEPFPKWRIMEYAFHLINHANLDNLFQDDFPALMSKVPGYQWSAFSAGFAVCLAALYAIVTLIRRIWPNSKAEETDEKAPLPASDAALASLLVWLLLPVIILMLMSITVIPSYLLIAQPAAFILIGFGAEACWNYTSGYRKMIRLTVISFVSVWCIYQVWLLFVLFQVLTGAVAIDYPYARYRDQRSVMRAIAEESEEERVLVRENFAPPEKSGLSFNYIYIIYQQHGEETLRRIQSRGGGYPQIEFVILDRKPYRDIDKSAPEYQTPSISIIDHHSITLIRHVLAGSQSGNPKSAE